MRQAFVIPKDKGNKFATLREDILSPPFVSLKTLQRFSFGGSLTTGRTGRTASDGELSIMRPLRYIPMLQRRLGAEFCAWTVTLWSPGITGWTIRRILTFCRPKLCCIRCCRLRSTLPLQEWTFTPTTAS